MFKSTFARARYNRFSNYKTFILFFANFFYFYTHEKESETEAKTRTV